jgi:hypothetical protein
MFTYEQRGTNSRFQKPSRFKFPCCAYELSCLQVTIMHDIEDGLVCNAQITTHQQTKSTQVHPAIRVLVRRIRYSSVHFGRMTRLLPLPNARSESQSRAIPHIPNIRLSTIRGSLTMMSRIKLLDLIFILNTIPREEGREDTTNVEVHEQDSSENSSFLPDPWG